VFYVFGQTRSSESQRAISFSDGSLTTVNKNLSEADFFLSDDDDEKLFI